MLTEQWRGYRNADGSKKKQKALPMGVLRKMMELASNPWEEAVSWLLVGAIFFAMRSCEFLMTTGNESAKRTRILRMRNIEFIKKGRIIPHDDKRLDTSDIVRIQFEFQKNDKRDIRVHMFRTDDKLLDPVKAWATTVKRVRSYIHSSDDSKVCTFMGRDGGIEDIHAEHVRAHLRAIVEVMGIDALGFTKDDIGLHSVRSGGAMAMFLSGTSTVIIRRVGRWSSEAFLEYIREQVEDFTAGVSTKMIRFENFNNLQMRIPHKDEKLEGERGRQPDKEDGPECVPFAVQFSRLALENEGGEVQRRITRRTR